MYYKIDLQHITKNLIGITHAKDSNMNFSQNRYNVWRMASLIFFK